MSIPRFYCLDFSEACLSEEESHHAHTVLRLKEGDQISLFDGKGAEAKAQILQTDKCSLRYKIITQNRSFLRNFQLTLGQAIPKGKSMDFIVQKSTELGVAVIAPILSDRSVVQLEGEKIESKQQKWSQTALEACKQCGQNYLPTVSPAVKLGDFLENYRKSSALKLIASLQSDAKPLRATLAEARENGMKLSEVIYLIGPEGDFTPSEIGQARSAGYLPVSLGPNILRTETATLFLTSALLYELQS
ncbi:MAG: 16S rRNA (uracil(1498)-N(3))-methyltransferase [Blastochloris sp.]|nr:16S rRNA (uracil(1498)-N(3))-methyltransferase [Blastochloris sp.]